MKVGELVDILKTYDQNLEVMYWDEIGEDGGVINAIKIEGGDRGKLYCKGFHPMDDADENKQMLCLGASIDFSKDRWDIVE